MSENVTIGQVLRRPAKELIGAAREVVTIVGFSFFPIILASAMFALKDHVDSLPAGDVKFNEKFWESLGVTLGGAHLLVYSLVSLGSVAAKIWPPSPIRFHHTWVFSIVIVVAALTAGALIGVDPTLQKLQSVPLFVISLCAYLLCTFMVFIVTMAYNVSAPDVQASSQAAVQELTTKLRSRRKARQDAQ